MPIAVPVSLHTCLQFVHLVISPLFKVCKKPHEGPHVTILRSHSLQFGSFSKTDSFYHWPHRHLWYISPHEQWSVFLFSVKPLLQHSVNFSKRDIYFRFLFFGFLFSSGGKLSLSEFSGGCSLLVSENTVQFSVGGMAYVIFPSNCSLSYLGFH